MPTTAKSKKSKSKSSRKVRTSGPRVIQWIETHCVFTAGRWRGQPFVLLPWQKRLILELFEVDETNRRRYRWALVGVPKKNGKTELAAALGLYFLLADGEPSPLVVCAASTKEQANLVFGAAKAMCELSPTLSKFTETYRDQIESTTPMGGLLKRVAAVDGANDGLNISAVICDELHEWSGEKGESVWTVLTNGTGAREQPMVLQITTAGYDRTSLCYREYERCLEIQRGESDRRNYYFHWAHAPEGRDPTDPETWRLANPSYGVTVQEDFFRDQFDTKPLFVFERYFLNRWTESSEAWLPHDAWDLCFDPDATIPKGAPIWLGIDIGIKRDTTALVKLWQRDDGKIVPEATVFTPPKDGQLEFSMIEAAIRDIAGEYHLYGGVYDPWRFDRSAEQLRSEGLIMDEHPMNNERMHPASARLYDLIISGKIAHNGDPVLASHVRAGAIKETERGWRLTKNHEAQANDALIAMCIAMTKFHVEAVGGFEW